MPVPTPTFTRLLTLAALLAAAAPAYGQRMSYGKAPMISRDGPKEPEGVAFDQTNLGQKVPLDATFYNHDGLPVTFAQLLNGKPTVVALGYYRCPKLCNQVQAGLLDVLKDARKADPAFTVGGPFNVVFLSVDPREAPTTLARPKRQVYLTDYDPLASDIPGWSFLTANHGQGTDVAAADRDIHAFADAVGFRYTLRAKQKTYVYEAERGWVGQLDASRGLPELPRDYDYQHASGVVILTPDGTISSYLLGINYSATDFRRAIVQAGDGGVGTFFERNVSPYCFVYDEVTGHYKPTMRYVAYAFTPVMLLVLYWTYRTIRKGLSEKPLTLPARAAGPPEPVAGGA